jgi:hypothetical protein
VQGSGGIGAMSDGVPQVFNRKVTGARTSEC